ncbi:MAG TPA: pyrrolo-quinoline quinone [Edaphobacter sp.]
MKHRLGFITPMLWNLHHPLQLKTSSNLRPMACTFEVCAALFISGCGGGVVAPAPVTVTSGFDVVTYHYDNSRTGLNPNETILTLANVNATNFGKLNFLSTDGKVDAEPLYLSSVAINGQTHNVLYVATEHASVYAFDADDGTQLWQVSALGANETTSDDHSCGQITPEIGITSTPVIDRNGAPNGAIFIVAMSMDDGGAYHQRLHALDITTGAELPGSPTEITATYPGSGANSSDGNVVFDPGQYAERVGLLLMNQTLYLAWTSHCDQGPYTGWVMAYSENTLQQTNVLNLTPNGGEGSVWMSGAGLAADASGNIFLLDANGTFDTTFTPEGFPSNNDYGNAILKLSTANNTLAVADFFEPYNTVYESNNDIDLGSGGALLLPDLTDSTGMVRHLVIGAGKDQNIYIADRDNLGKFNPTDNSNLYEEVPNAMPNGAFSKPAYFNNTIYYAGVGDNLKAFPIANATLSATPSSLSAATFPYPGATPGISANGTDNGIVWALESDTGAPAVLHAYDAANLANELYNSEQASDNRDSFGFGNKFMTPLIVNGKVYVGTPNGVAVFGLLNQQ